jgi:hypothetical protein
MDVIATIGIGIVIFVAFILLRGLRWVLVAVTLAFIALHNSTTLYPSVADWMFRQQSVCPSRHSHARSASETAVRSAPPLNRQHRHKDGGK